MLRRAKAVEAIAAAAREVKGEYDQSEEGSVIQHILTATGTQGANARHGASGDREAESHVGEVVMELTPSEERETPSDEIANQWRERVGAIPDLVELIYSWSRENAGEAVNVRLQGQDVEDLRMASQAPASGASHAGRCHRTSPTAFAVASKKSSWPCAHRPKHWDSASDDLARQVRQAFYGEEVQRIQRDRDDVRVMLRYPKDQRRSLSNLEDMWIRTPNGDEVPFSSVAKVDIGRGFASISRTDRQRRISVTADVDRQSQQPQ